MNEIEKQQLCETTLKCLRYGVGSLSDLPGLIEKIIDAKAWEARQVRTGEIVYCENLAELITARPLKGWGESLDKVKAVLNDHPKVLAKFRKAVKAKPGPNASSCNNVTETKPQNTGNSRAYTCERLQRESPELFAEVEAGRMSANAAAIAAGIRKKPSQEEICVKAFRKADVSKLVHLLTPEEIVRLREALHEVAK